MTAIITDHRAATQPNKPPLSPTLKKLLEAMKPGQRYTFPTGTMRPGMFDLVNRGLVRCTYAVEVTAGGVNSGKHIGKLVFVRVR